MPIKVVELFAGVGGFRIGLEGWNKRSSTTGYTKRLNSKYKVVWSNQFEPSTKVQHASDIYIERFGEENHINEDIEKIRTKHIPNHDLLVGGFPCQDYSVATSLINSQGLIGKKGVLWWSIERILREKRPRPRYLLLENVDRMLKSPAKQRGRDFAIMLKSLDDLGYAVEWKVINAGEYGLPQRRRRVFIIGYHRSTKAYKNMKRSQKLEWLCFSSTISKAFPLSINSENHVNRFELENEIVDISEKFNLNGKRSPFENTGLMIDGQVVSIKSEAVFNRNKNRETFLGDILQNGEVPKDFFIKHKDLKLWKYHKGAKKIKRMTSEGFAYDFSEGGMIFPDRLDTASRTLITSEGGPTPSRFKHVVKVGNKYRRLTPVEMERLNMFPDDFTLKEGISDVKRAFFMGNALVVGVIEKIGKELSKVILDDRLVDQLK